jgi:hypothetical protein
MKAKTFEVEFWPGHIVTVTLSKEEVESDTPNDYKAFCKAFEIHGWPGGCEASRDGLLYKAWVREIAE